MKDPSRVDLAAGKLEATVLPGYGMLVASLRSAGVEMLRRIDNLDDAAAKGSTAGIPLLYPWANRLAGLHYQAAGRAVALDPNSPLLHFDANGLPIHGVPWSKFAWRVIERRSTRVVAHFDWSSAELLAIFPFPHTLEMTVSLDQESLGIEVSIKASTESAVPVSFGFHPYFGLAELPRAKWRLQLPAMQRLALDKRGIPTGAMAPFAPFDGALGETAFDDGFALSGDPAAFSLSDRERRISVEFGDGFHYAQVYAPKGQDLIALEPMTAPTNALISGDGLHVVPPGKKFDAKFRIRARAA